MKKFKKLHSPYKQLLLISTASFFLSSTSYANQDLISLFPLDNYNQSIATWINPNDPDYDRPLLNTEMQQNRLNIFYDHYFGALSPWNAEYVSKILHQSAPNDLKTLEQTLINNFSNDGKSDNLIGYGENFRAHDKDWIEKIAANINSSQFDAITYQASNRGIAIDNLHARVLPTADVHFYSYKLAGQGYPFDNLQMSALWAGTPVYIVAETRDHAWMLVITPDYIAWVKSSGIARTSAGFINKWTKTAKDHLVAITHTQTPLVDNKGTFLLSAYVGSVFPGNSDSGGIKVMVPMADPNRHAFIKHALISNNQAAFMPITASPHNFASVMRTLLGRTYGWGSMYFYNDCSAELKSLLTPFGIWLPRHSSDQVTVGKMVDMSLSAPDKRLSYLMENGQRFLTIVNIGGHVFLYIGNYADPNRQNAMLAMTYQNMWGLSPNPPVRRAVIGKSVLFPLFLQYSEDPSLESQAAKKFFQVSYLNQLPDFGYLLMEKTIDLKSLMYPENHDY